MKLSMKSTLFLGLGAIVVATFGNQANAAGYVRSSCFVQTDALIRPQLQPYFTQTQISLLGDLTTMDTAVKKAAKEQADYISAAVTVLSTQKAVSTAHINDSIKNNTQLQASAMQAINTTKRVKEAMRDYGTSGLGYKICKVHNQRVDIKDASEDAQAAVDDMVNGEVTARAGKYANRNDAMATRLALHNKYYCTEGQAKAGMCEGAGPREGKSLMASTMFEPADYLSQEYNDKSAFINNMVGLPDDPVSEASAVTVAGQSYMDMKRRKDAIKSTAITSLKAIQADWSSVPSSHAEEDDTKIKDASTDQKAVAKSEGDQLNKDAPETKKATDDTTKADEHSSLMVQVKADVDRYLGGTAEYEEWSKTLAGQEEKGVLSEVLKVKALRLYLQHEQYQQLQRMEAMLAANVAAQLENSGMSAKVDSQRQRAVRQTIKQKLIVE